MPPQKPNLFIVGAPRCGTTTLHGYLAGHPDVFMTEDKEPHYLCRDLREECDAFHGRAIYFPYRNDDQYLHLFDGARGERVRGESSVYYLYSRTSAEEIAAFAPDARAIVMVREPVAFLASLHAKLRYMGDEDRPSLQEAMAVEEDRVAGRKVPRGVRLPRFLHYSDAAHFSEHIDRFRAALGEDRVKVALLDDFKQDEQAFVGDVLEWLGVERRALQRPDTINPNQEARWRTATLLQRSLELRMWSLSRDPGFEAHWWTRVLPFKVLRKVAGTVDRLNSRRAERRPLDPAFRRELQKRFRPDVERLGAMLGRDLVELWGY